MTSISMGVEVDPHELWESTFGSSFEQWEWWRSVEYLDGADWDKPGMVRLGIDDPTGVEDTYTLVVTMPRLLQAVEQAVNTCVDACTGQPINVKKGEVDFDACVGDCILQIAVLGEVVYG